MPWHESVERLQKQIDEDYQRFVRIDAALAKMQHWFVWSAIVACIGLLIAGAAIYWVSDQNGVALCRVQSHRISAEIRNLNSDIANLKSDIALLQAVNPNSKRAGGPLELSIISKRTNIAAKWKLIAADLITQQQRC